MTRIPVSPDDPQSIRLLIVEDDSELAALLVTIFAGNPDFATAVTVVETLARAREALDEASFDVVMLDLGLPDSGGLRTARSIVDLVEPPTAVVVVTARRDAGLAAQALEIGAQDYVVKEDLTPQLVTRIVWYGVTRARLTHELDQARRGEERERELRRMERLAAERGTTSVSASMLGAQSVSEQLGRRYEDELVDEYRRILVAALEAQAYRVTNTVDADLRSLASVLGFLGAGPRDVIELHTRCMRAQLAEDETLRAAAAVEEARVLVLQLMGRLVSHYRERSIGHSSSGGSRSGAGGGPSRDASEAPQTTRGLSSVPSAQENRQ